MSSDDKYIKIEDLHGNQIIFNAQAVFTARKRPIEISVFKAKVRLLVYTPEGPAGAEPGDYIIKGIKGEFSVDKKESFEQTYEVLSKE